MPNKSQDALSKGDRLRAELIKKAEKSAKKITEENLAGMLGVKRGTLQGWLNNRKISDEALARAFEIGLDVRYILTGESAPKASGLTPAQLETVEACNLLIGILLEVQKAALDDPIAAEAGAGVLSELKAIVEKSA